MKLETLSEAILNAQMVFAKAKYNRLNTAHLHAVDVEYELEHAVTVYTSVVTPALDALTSIMQGIAFSIKELAPAEIRVEDVFPLSDANLYPVRFKDDATLDFDYIEEMLLVKDVTLCDFFAGYKSQPESEQLKFIELFGTEESAKQYVELLYKQLKAWLEGINEDALNKALAAYDKEQKTVHALHVFCKQA